MFTRQKLTINQGVLFVCLTFLIVLFFFNRHFIEPTGIVEAWFTTKGLVFYRDFVTYHFPLGRWILIPVLLLSDWDLRPIPFLALGIGITNILLIYSFGKKYLTQLGLTVSLLFFSIFYWFFATQIIFFHDLITGILITWIILLIFPLIEKRKFSTHKLFLVGFLISTTELFGQLASITLFVILLFIILRLTSKGVNQKHFATPIYYLSLGLFFPFIFITFYFTFNHALQDFFYWNVTYYLEYANNNKNSLFALPFKELLGFYSPLIVLIYLSLINLLKKKTDTTVLFILALSLSTLPFVIFGIYHPHHLSYALPIMALTSGFVFNLKRDYGGKNKIIFYAGFLYLSFVVATTILPWYKTRLIFPPSLTITNDVIGNRDDPMYDSVEWVKKNTSPDTRIQVTADPLFFLRSERLPANKYAKGIPAYFWKPFDKAKATILNSLPDYWIIETGFMKRLRATSGWDSPEMADFIHNKLEECYEQRANFSGWQIWQLTCPQR